MPATKWLLLFILLLVVGCREEPSEPTATPAVMPGAQETTAPGSTGLPATATVPQASPVPPTPTSVPTETTQPTATSLPPTSTVEPTASVPLSLTAPEAEATLDVGDEVTVTGEVAAGVDGVTVSLEAAGVTLVENNVPLQDTATSWETVLSVPESFSGRALLRVSGADEMIERPVLLRRPATAGTSIELTHPDVESTAVSGHVLFFTGLVQQPRDGEITIAVLYEECETVGARQTFEVGQGGQWWGFVLIPDTVFGPACAIAYTGGFEGEGWRASATPLTILEADDPAARGIFIGNFAREEIVPREVVTVYGSAYNTRQVDVSLEVGNQTVAEDTADVNPFGYWEIELTVPAEVVAGNEGFYVATTSYGGEVVEARSPFVVVAE